MLVQHSRLPAWPRSTSDDPYFGPYKILSVDGHRITVRCSPRLGGTLVCAAQHLKRYYDPEDLCGEEWELNDEEIAALDLQGAASPMEVEGDLPDMNAEEMAKEGFYLVKSVLRHRYRQGWRFLTLGEGFGVEEATWKPCSAFVLPEGRLKSVLVDYLSCEAGLDPRGHLWVTWGVYLCAGKPPLADIILSHPPDLTRCDSVIRLAIPAMSGHIQYRGAASGDLYIGISGINRVFLS